MNKPLDPFDPMPQSSKTAAGGTLIAQATPALVAFWRIVGQQRYWVIGAVAIAVLLGWIAGRLAEPSYQAVSTLLIETGKSKVVSIEEVYPGLSSDREHFRTQTQFLRSREVALRVIRDLDLVRHPRFADVVRQARETAPAATDPAEAGVVAKGERPVVTDPAEEAVLRALSRSLDIEPVRQSQLLLVKYESPDPVLAARIANRTAEAFIQAEMDMRLQMTISASNWLSERVAELKQRLDASEKVLADSRERANLLDRRGTSLGAAGQQTADLLQRQVDARVKLAQLEQLYRQVRPGVPGRENAAPVVSHPGVIRARDVVADAEAKFSAAAGRYGSSHPAYRAAQVELEAARASLKSQTERVITSIEKDYQVAVATEKSLQATVDRNRAAAQRDNRKEAEIAILEQDVLSNRQLYQTFLSRLKETATAADVQTPQARIVDAAVAPDTPVKPRKALLLASFGIVGLLVGVAIAMIRSQTDSRIRSIEEVEQALGLPVITTLPVLTKAQQRDRGRLVATDPAAYFSEMMRMGAASIHFSMLEDGTRSMAITSATASEGKSTVATNLALALSRTNRVLLIDGDLYRPVQHRLLGLESSEKGLVQVLRGDLDVTDAIQTVGGTRLKVIPAGKVSGEAFNIVTPSHLRRLIRMLEDDFDIVLVDAPPLEVVSDGMLIGASCNSTVLVTRSGATPLALVGKALRRLTRVRARVLGVVVNGHDFQAAERFYGEASGYKGYEAYTKGQGRAKPAGTGTLSLNPALERLGVAKATAE
ncbi:MAG: GumC family protein [Lautropia sp.]